MSAAALAVLVSGALCSAGAAWYVARTQQEEARGEFLARSAVVTGILERRLDAWTEVLNGVHGLFVASQEVTRAEFRRHYQHLELERRFPGFLSLQFVRRVRDDERAAFEAAVRADTSVAPRGYPGFSIQPPGRRAEYLVTDYIEPLVGNEAAFGFDVASTSAQRAALERGRDSGRLTASGPVWLVQDPGSPAGYVLRMPVYRPGLSLHDAAQRREGFVGMVSVVLRMDDFMGAAVADAALQGLDFRLHDLGRADLPLAAPSALTLLHDTAQRPGRAPARHAFFTQVTQLPVGGRVWRLEFRSRDEAMPFAPWLALVGGLLVSVLLSRLVQQQVAARQAAEQISRAKSEFLARTSHELRTPLNAVLGFAQLMEMDPQAALAPAQRERVQRIREAGTHLLAMIGDMLDLAGIESGRVVVVPAAVPLAPLVAECVAALGPQAGEAGVELRGGDWGPLAVQADARRLRQILLNLLSNAVKYNRRGGWVEVQAQPAPGGRVRLTVADSGQGLSNEQLAQLFQPFNRAGAERSGIPGVGLGLAVSRGLAQLMGGGLWAAHRDGGEGSIFTLELPAAS